MSVKRTSAARPGAARPDGRGLPPGADGVPRRGRRRRLALRRRPTPSRPSRSSTTSRRAPACGPSARSGRGAAAWPSASTSRAQYDEKTFVVRAGGQRGLHRPRVVASPRPIDPAQAASCSPRCRAEGGVADRLRLDDGRGSRQARRPFVARRQPMPEFADVVRRRRMTRAFDGRPVPAELLDELVDLGVAGTERRQDPGLAPRRAGGRRDGPVLGHHAAADAPRRVPLAAAARRPGDRPPARRPAGLHRPLLRARQAGDRARRGHRGVAGAVLDHRRLDVGDDDAAGRRGRRARRAVLRGVHGRARAAPGARASRR